MMDKRLLLVDDEEGIRKVLGIVLADIGYDIVTAADGKQGLQQFLEQRPPIVITDIKMPVMDGIELLQQIKREDPDTEVIMLTGHGDMELAIQCLKLEATDFVTKPINDDALEIALKRANERILMRRQLREYTENLERLVEEKSAQLVDAERRAAVGQALEGLTTAMQNIAGDLDSGISCFNDLPCFVSIHSPEYKVVAANQRYIAKLGSPDRHSSGGLYKSTGPSPAEVTFASGRGQRINTTAHFPDGTETPVIVHTAPIRNADGQVELVVEIAADVAEIRRLRDDLQMARHRYQLLFNEAPCYITVQDRQLRITEANRLFREDFGGDARARCFEVYRKREAACSDCPVAKTFDDGAPHQKEMDVVGPDGSPKRMLVQTAPLCDSAGRITHVMEMSTDVTQIRKLQEHLAALGLMIGSVSHGIKGLLTGLDGSMYLVDRGVAKAEPDLIREGWDTLREMIERIRNLVMDILYYAKEKDLKWQRVDVVSFVEEISGQFEPKAVQLGIGWRCEVADDLKTTHVDPGMVQAILSNILDNAIEACVADTDRTKQHVISFKVYAEQHDIVFQVIDNAKGMDSDTQARIFAPDFISHKREGSGLGLFIARQILKKNSGQIKVESSPGAGSVFTVRLPKAVGGAAEACSGARPR